MNIRTMKQMLENRIGLMIRCEQCGEEFDFGTTLLKDEDYLRARFNNYVCDKCWRLQNKTLR